MISGIGTDIEKIERFEPNLMGNEFMERVFTKGEIDYCLSKKNPSSRFAGKFCAKEAVVKAHSGNLTINQIEVLTNSMGKSKISINGKIEDRILCSISHEAHYAIAFVIIQD